MLCRFRITYLVIKFESSEPSTNIWTPDSEIKLRSAFAGLSSSSRKVSIYKIFRLILLRDHNFFKVTYFASYTKYLYIYLYMVERNTPCLIHIIFWMKQRFLQTSVSHPAHKLQRHGCLLPKWEYTLQLWVEIPKHTSSAFQSPKSVSNHIKLTEHLHHKGACIYNHVIG